MGIVKMLYFKCKALSKLYFVIPEPAGQTGDPLPPPVWPPVGERPPAGRQGVPGAQREQQRESDTWWPQQELQPEHFSTPLLLWGVSVDYF